MTHRTACRVAFFAVMAPAFLMNPVTAFTKSASVPMTRESPAAEIRPFRVSIPQAALDDLRQRVLATRWPDRETVNDDSQGVKQATLQELARYWATDYDWRKVETQLNSLPQFVTHIDGLDIHFIHVKSRHPHALPLIITHGWPGSILEMIDAIGPLTDPTAFGGKAEDAFDVVIPSIPGYGFSERPAQTGWGPERVGRAWDVLMKRLGYTHYVSQGGDHGSVISDAMARQAPAGLLGIHLSMPATLPDAVVQAINNGGPAPVGLSAKERAAFDSLYAFFSRNAAYGAMMVTRPQTVGYALSDSPVGLAGWMYEKIAQWTYSGGVPERSLTRDQILDDISLYWLTNSAVSAARFYWENNNNNFSASAQKTRDIALPVAVTVFPGEIYRAPETWTRQAYPSLMYFHEVDKGGHFAAWEEPELFARELRDAFRPLRGK
ncbi:MAG TPA: epoxide hydrolase [Povalibacter sp.]|nr:epoxide hydrolase [Povalibacter sp.]